MSTSPVPDLNALFSYDYEVDLSGTTAAAHIIRMTGRGGKVLDLGAGAGAITRHLVETNGCDVVAVEANPASVTKLQTFCRKVLALDLNSPGWPAALATEAPFDRVLATDVLEHLYDPWRTLRAMATLVKPDGAILLSLPHAAHCTVLASLMQEDFAYGEWGLLDKTHIRFFGVNNIQAMLDDAGLVVEDAAFVLRPPERTELAEKWARMPPGIQALLTRSPYAHVYQIVVRARLARAGVRGVRLIDLPVAG